MKNITVIFHIDDKAIEFYYTKNIISTLCSGNANFIYDIEQKNEIKEKSIVVTSLNISEKHLSNKKDIIVFHLSDEFYKIPPWYNNVNLVCRNYAFRQNIAKNVIYFPIGINNYAMIDTTKNIPKLKPINERPIDIGFCGQWSSSDTRRSMYNNIVSLGSRYKTDIRMNETFFDQRHISNSEYLDFMNNCKMFCCPWGGSPETMRMSEAFMMGCIPIVYKQIAHPWYIDGWSAIEIDSWNVLDIIVDRFLSTSLDRQAERQQKCIKWYEEKISPKAVANHIVEYAKHNITTEWKDILW